MGPRIRLARSLIIAAAATLAATDARAQDTAATATTTGSTSIGAPVAITVTQNLSFNVSQTVNTGLTITSSAVGGINANVVLTGGQTASVSVPATFDVTRVGGVETVTVRTVGPVTNVVGTPGVGQVTGVANGGIFSAPVAIVGSFDAGVLSFSVGGQVTLANNLVPGQYQGVLTVVAQYN
jgi:hypothetical protein